MCKKFGYKKSPVRVQPGQGLCDHIIDSTIV